MNVSKRRLVGSGSLLPGGFLLGGLSIALPSASGSIYSLTNIGAAVANATGATKSFGYALNDSGTVVGTESPDSYNVPYSVYQYSGGAVSVISNSAPNFFYAESYMAINNAGTVAYTYGTGASDEAAIFSPATGQTTSVPDQGNGVTATAINSAGTVVGTLQVPYSSSYSTSQAYVLKSGVQTNVGAQFSGANASGTSYASAINDSGQIAGIGVVPGTNGVQEAYIATPNGSTGTYSFNNVGALVLAANSHRSSPNLTAINNAGWAVGTFNDYSGDLPGSAGNGPFAYLYNGSKIIYFYGLGGTSYLGVTPTAINSSGQVVGTSSLASAKYSTDAFLYQNGNTQDLNNLLDSSGAGWTLTNATGINASGQIVGYGTYNSSGTVVTSAFLLTPEAATLTWNNSHTIGTSDPNATTDNNNDINPTDGKTWDANTTQNWNGGSTTVDTIFSNGDNVTFNDNNNGHYLVQILSTVQPGSTVVSTAAAYNFIGNGGIGGTTGLTKTGAGSLSLSITDSYTGATNISGGTVSFNNNSALPNGSALIIGAGAQALVANHGTGSRILLQPSSLSLAGTSSAWTAKLDLSNNDLVVPGGSLTTITNQIRQGYNGGGSSGGGSNGGGSNGGGSNGGGSNGGGSNGGGSNGGGSSGGAWNASNGIVSSAAAMSTSHLTALGVIINTADGTTPLYGSSGSLGLFDGTSPAASTILVRYTYYGDANLDGKVDGSDYSRIDAAFLNNSNSHNTPLTGWYNGDFNYDGVINGSDYTLIDNAFNTQGTALPSELISPQAVVTAQIAGTTAVPEPGTLVLFATVLPTLLGRRKSLRRWPWSN